MTNSAGFVSVPSFVDPAPEAFASNPGSTLVVIGAVLIAAVLAMVMLGLIIWRQSGEQNRLREQLAAAEAQAAADAQMYAQQHAAMQEVMVQLQADREDDIQVMSPVEWSTCLSCRSPLQVVLCPHCHSPYHKQWTSPRGKILNCWEAVLASGRCWNCKQDLTQFQKAPGHGAAASTPAYATPMGAGGPVPPRPVAPPYAAPFAATNGGAEPPARALPKIIAPTRQEAPATPEMLEQRRKGVVTGAGMSGPQTGGAPAGGLRPGQGHPGDEDDDFQVV